MRTAVSRVLSMSMIVLLILLTPTVYADIMPRWAELNTYQCALSYRQGLFSNANVASTASTHSVSSKLELTLTIQIWNGSEYVDTSNSWSSSGSGATSIEKNVMLGQGNYRAKSVVNVYSAGSSYIETVTRYSDSMII